jgi:ABC-type branched-subunit amino acid transport system substrate-binding protein
VRLVADAIAVGKGTSLSGSGIRDFLRGVREYAGASGTITFDDRGDVIKPYAIRTIDAGRPKTIVVK